MQDLRGGGRTVLFVSHNMAAVENLCTRGIWIANGQMQSRRADARGDRGVHGLLRLRRERLAATSPPSHGRRGSGEIRFTRVEFLSAWARPQSRHALRARASWYACTTTPTSRSSARASASACYADLGTLVTDYQHLAARHRYPAGPRRRRLRRPGDRRAQPGAGPLLPDPVDRCVPAGRADLRPRRARGASRHRGGPDLRVQCAASTAVSGWCSFRSAGVSMGSARKRSCASVRRPTADISQRRGA